MSRIAYVNGQYELHGDAFVHVEDRGYQFADAVYEVCEIRNGLIVDETGHMDRLERSLSELEIANPMSRQAFGLVLREVVRRNLVKDGIVYIQVSRGVSPRNHAFPPAGVRPSVVLTAKHMKPKNAAAEKGGKAVTVPENRWERVDIKTVGLLSNCIAKEKATQEGAYEAWYVTDDGMVTEGSSSNAWIVTKDGVLVTRQATGGILKGITRGVVLRMCKQMGLRFEERAFSLEDAFEAREAFVTSATSIVMPIVQIDDRVIGNGHPGNTSIELRKAFHSHAELVPLHQPWQI